MSFRCLIQHSIGLALLAAYCTQAAFSQQPLVRIGFALDGPSELNNLILESLEEEIGTILEGEFEVQFPSDKRMEADWTADGVRSVIDRLPSDSDVDLVIASGVLCSHEAALRSELRKPVFAALIVDPRLQGVPLEIRERPLPPPDDAERVRVSGRRNLSYLTLGIDLLQEAGQFIDIAPFSRLAVVRGGSFGIPDVSLAELQPLDAGKPDTRQWQISAIFG